MTLAYAVEEATLARDDKIVLWQIHPDGTYVSFVVEENKLEQAYSAPVNVTYPTTALLTDNMNGTLIPIRISHALAKESIDEAPDEYIYRVNQNGELVVITSDELGFATRGGFLIAFNVSEGKELWRWDSDTALEGRHLGSEISVPSLDIKHASITCGKRITTPAAVVDDPTL